MNKKPYYMAVVETGWHSPDCKRYEEKRTCGHKHKSITAAALCGEKNYASRELDGNWTANAAWHLWTVHDDGQQRVNMGLAGRDGTPRQNNLYNLGKGN